jgi:S1-C subfamily serine protease
MHAIAKKQTIFLGTTLVLALVHGQVRTEEPKDSLHATAVKGTVWINDRGGTGVLVHRADRLIVTNWHVVRDRNTVEVIFPVYLKGSVIQDRDFFWKYRKQFAVKGQVLHRDKTRDLAIVQVESVPNDARPLTLARQNVRAGDKIYRLGSPAAKDESWKLVAGRVKWHRFEKISYKRTEQQVRAMVIGSDILSHGGNSGGPVVNERCELVGVHSGGGGEQTAYHISGSEVRAMLTECRENHLTRPMPQKVRALDSGLSALDY